MTLEEAIEVLDRLVDFENGGILPFTVNEFMEAAPIVVNFAKQKIQEIENENY